MDDRYDLSRFVEAQRDSYDAALAELRRGHKTGHWMWWIFPQLADLGRSGTARHYGIADAGEARAYLTHPLLGHRLVTAAAAVVGARGDADTIMGGIDALKLRSSATLFGAVADDPTPFRAVLERFYAGKPDPLTLGLLDRGVTPAPAPG